MRIIPHFAMSNATETALCGDGDVTDEGQEDLLLRETDKLSMEHGLENLSGSTEDITTCKGGNSNYITWTVDIVLAVPKGTFIISFISFNRHGE